MRLNLLTKILLWVFVNLLVLGIVLYFIFNLNFRFAPNSPLLGAANERLEGIAAIISAETRGKNRAEIDKILKDFSQEYGLDFTIFTNQGEQVGGKEINLPPKILQALNRRPPPQPGMRPNMPMPPPGGPSIRIERTSSPSTYWAIARVPFFKGNSEAPPIPSAIIARSDSITGNGLFFNPKPWIVTIAVILGLSILIWFPFVRNLNKSISQLTNATEQIAKENFSVRVDESRKDEIGRLGNSVNHLAERLSGFVHGQKRFLGDISHELNSPLARMNWALSILETKTNEADQKYIDDVREEVELMAKLVRELLSYSKAGIKGTEVRLENIELVGFIKKVIEREKILNSNIRIEIDEDLSVRANRDLLSRALSNILQNSIRYAGEDKEIVIKAEAQKNNVFLRISDQGDGVPENEIERLFDPLYRVEKDRARQSGGTGLGLAIVKTCIEACEGRVSARNLSPKGFEIEFQLKSADTPDSK
jgi:two-component system sensor histidine kinase CpxA